MQSLQSLTDIRNFFRHNQIPLYYVSTTMFNLLGADEWINNLTCFNMINSFAGQHPNIFVPADAVTHGLAGIEAANTYLLQHPAVAEYVQQRGGGGVLFLMFDEQTETLAHKLGLKVCFPPAALRHYLDSKATTTRLANWAGVPSVPNVLARVDSYATLRQVARALGPDLVVQLPYGDSGVTTFFMATEADFRAYAQAITQQPEVKIMRRIRCRQVTIEGCVTRRGTLVGPLMTEMIGFPELTPYRGGWCGNEVFADRSSTMLTPELRQRAQRATLAMGEQIRKEGYWGYFGLDFLLDQDTGELYLGELNPRITGVTALTSQAALDQNEAPLLLLHLLEALGVEYALDIEQYNQRWLTAAETPSWSQLLMERTEEGQAILTHVPPTGIWRMAADGTVNFLRMAFQVQAVANQDEAFFIRTVDVGHQPGQGYCLGRLLTRGRLLTDEYRLTPRAQAWIRGLRAQFMTQAAWVNEYLR